MDQLPCHKTPTYIDIVSDVDKVLQYRYPPPTTINLDLTYRDRFSVAYKYDLNYMARGIGKGKVVCCAS